MDVKENHALVRENQTLKAKLKGLIQHCEHLEQKIAKRDSQLRRLNYGKVDGNVWYWMTDEENHLESLSCPVVIDAVDLRDLLADVVKKEKVP